MSSLAVRGRTATQPCTASQTVAGGMPKCESCSAKARGWTRGAHLGFGLRLAISTRKLRHMRTCNKEYLDLVSQVVLPSFGVPATLSMVWLLQLGCRCALRAQCITDAAGVRRVCAHVMSELTPASLRESVSVVWITPRQVRLRALRVSGLEKMLKRSRAHNVGGTRLRS